MSLGFLRLPSLLRPGAIRFPGALPRWSGLCSTLAKEGSYESDAPGVSPVLWMMVAVAAGLICGDATASEYVGTLVLARSAASPTTSGNTCVSVQVAGAPSSCGSDYWHSYDLPDASVGKTWTATLLAALATGRTVRIGGSGTCDACGLETLYYMDALP